MSQEKEKELAFRMSVVRRETLGQLEDRLNAGTISQAEYEYLYPDTLQDYIQTVAYWSRSLDISVPVPNPITLQNLNQETILLVAVTRLVLNQWVNLWSKKEITWEQAIIGISLQLAQDAQYWRSRTEEIILKHPMGFWLQPNDYAVIVKKDELTKTMQTERNPEVPE